MNYQHFRFSDNQQFSLLLEQGSLEVGIEVAIIKFLEISFASNPLRSITILVSSLIRWASMRRLTQSKTEKGHRGYDHVDSSIADENLLLFLLSKSSKSPIFGCTYLACRFPIYDGKKNRNRDSHFSHNCLFLNSCRFSSLLRATTTNVDDVGDCICMSYDFVCTF